MNATATQQPQLFRRTLLPAVAALVLACVPVVMLLFALVALTPVRLTQLMPLWSDEIYYWHQTATFRAVGLAGGYYTVNEIPALTAGLHYNAWGPFVPGFYAALSGLTGWTLNTIPILNNVLLILALWVLFATVGFVWRRMLAFTGVLATFVPFMMFAPSSMLEGLQYAVAILLAGVFLHGLARHDAEETAMRLPLALGYGLLLITFALLRLTWALLFFPLLALLFRPHRLSQWLFVLLTSGGLFVVLALGMGAAAAPDLKFVQSLPALLREEVLLALRSWLDHIGQNISLLLSGYALEIGQRLQYGVFIFGLGWWGMQRAWSRWPRLLSDTDGAARWEVRFHLYNLGTIFLFQILLYDIFDWRDYRVLAPHLLLSLLVLVGRCRWRWVGLGVVSMLLLLPAAAAEHQNPNWYGRYATPEQHRAYEYWQAELDERLTYQPGAAPWCNTVLHTFIYFEESALLLAVPPGMGLSMVLDETQLAFPLQSHYLLLDDDFKARHAEQLTLDLLVSTPYGGLYRNQDAACSD